MNSVATGDALRDRLGGVARDMPIVVAPLGIDLTGPQARTAEGRPYFVCVGTIGARKNHRLLLDLWRRLARDLGERAPRLLLIGGRGFGSERIVEKITALEGLVIEHAGLSDATMSSLLRGARASLLPSLAEGFGLPVAEALAAGVPVLCSELPALRESGGGVPDYLDPADIEGWRQAILDFVTDSPRRRAQLARLAGWRPPDWEDHFAIVDRLIDAFG